jgi:hypothetical protein
MAHCRQAPIASIRREREREREKERERSFDMDMVFDPNGKEIILKWSKKFL